MDDDDVRMNLQRFLDEVVPLAEELGLYLAVHPDDPPRRLFGLPRIVSTDSDVKKLLSALYYYDRDSKAVKYVFRFGQISSLLRTTG